MSSYIVYLEVAEDCLKRSHWPNTGPDIHRCDYIYSGFDWDTTEEGYDFWNEEVRPGEPISEQAKIYLQTMIDSHKLGV